MDAYAYADRVHEEKMSRDIAIEAIFEEMMEDRELVRQTVVDVRNKHWTAKSGGEFGDLVRRYVWELAASEYESGRTIRKEQRGEW